jgi:hypothetical protein
MKTLLTSVLGLTAMASVALAGEAVYLTSDQMDRVTAGAASATLELGNILASGPNNATVRGTNIGAVAVVVGGSAPSNAAAITGSFEAQAD